MLCNDIYVFVVIYGDVLSVFHIFDTGFLKRKYM